MCIVEPKSDIACGMGGVLCQNCREKAGFFCTGGQCGSLLCNAANCPGCCTATGACVLSTVMTRSQCGPRGGLCGACGADQACTNVGACCSALGTACTSSSECCVGLTCVPTATGATCQ